MSHQEMSDLEYAIQVLTEKKEGLQRQIDKDKSTAESTKFPSYIPILSSSIRDGIQKVKLLNSSINLLNEEVKKRHAI